MPFATFYQLGGTSADFYQAGSMMTPMQGAVSQGFGVLPASVGLGATNQVTNANLNQLIKQSQHMAAQQKHMQQTLMAGPARVAQAPTAQQLAAATQGQTMAQQLYAQHAYLYAQKAPYLAHMTYSTQAQMISGMAPTLEESFAMDAGAAHTGLATALGAADMAMLDANRLTNLLPATAFASSAEQAAQRELYRTAMHAARCNPDSALSYLGTISAAAPSLMNTIKSVMRTTSQPMDGQPLLTTDGVRDIRQYLIQPVAVPKPSSCSASLPTANVLLKNRYMADTLGAYIFTTDQAGAYAPLGLTPGVIAAAELGAELLK